MAPLYAWPSVSDGRRLCLALNALTKALVCGVSMSGVKPTLPGTLSIALPLASMTKFDTRAWPISGVLGIRLQSADCLPKAMPQETSETKMESTLADLI